MPTNKASRAGVGLAVAAAIVAGTLVARDQLQSGAARPDANVRVAEQNAKAKVPFNGPFARNHKGITECGPSVRLMEGALRRTTPPIRKAPAANCIGVATEHQIKAFQKRHGIPQTGIYGTRTHNALSHAYSKQQIIDLAYLARQRLAALRRSTILVITSHAYALRGLMGYCDFGSLAQCGHRGVWPAWPDVPRHTDCSGYSSWVLETAGVPNPNGVGVGSTHTLILHGTAVATNAQLKVGDLIFYSANNSHVAVYIGHGLVSGHGRPGIDINPFGYRPIFAIRRYF